jgi:hypothetical protein
MIYDTAERQSFFIPAFQQEFSKPDCTKYFFHKKLSNTNNLINLLLFKNLYYTKQLRLIHFQQFRIATGGWGTMKILCNDKGNAH